MDRSKIVQQIEKFKPEMVETLMQLISIPAVGPECGCEGEYVKAQALMQILDEVGFDEVERYDVADQRVPTGKRPNIVAYCNGEKEEPCFWIVTHLDVVPSGDETQWTITKPFEPKIKDGCVYGRGSEDNGQSLVASIYAVKALRQMGIKPKRKVALAFVADEEQGSTKGIQHLIERGIFGKNDLVLVPDSGNSKGDFIEVAEKSILWFKLTTCGKQAHGSMPNKGVNAHRIGMQIALTIDERLHSKYNMLNECFTEPASTFEPTRKDKNVDSVNIVPGEDIVYFDCRILPNYKAEDVITDVNRVIEEFEDKMSVKIKLGVLQKQVAPDLMDYDFTMVNLLRRALKEVRNIDATVGGIGGGTCAAFFRKQGIKAVAWSTIDEVAHQPNEYCKIRNMVEDAKIFAQLAMM